MAHHTTERDDADRPAEERADTPANGNTEIDEERARRAANLFDLRRLIGGLFLIYGAILTVLGIGASQAEIDKAAGINLNLWVGLSLLVVGGLFLLWAFTRPLSEQLGEDDEGYYDDDDGYAEAHSETTGREARFDRDDAVREDHVARS
jgi:hypothetical protein